jgi:magnesium transporter
MKKSVRKKINPLNFIFTGKQYHDNAIIELFKYTKDSVGEIPITNVEDFKGFKNENEKYWLNISGLHETEKITRICTKLGIHNLSIQDILDVNQRPKFQQYEEYLFFSMKSVIKSSSYKTESEQISFILGRNFIVSFQEKKGNYFDHIRYRLRENVGIIRQTGVDYILFLSLESIIDNYFKTVDEIVESIDTIQVETLTKNATPDIINDIELNQRLTYKVKKSITPIKEFTTLLERSNSTFIDRTHLKFYYELKDLALTVIDECDYLGSMLESKINLYFSIQGHNMNQVMKTLTIVATIFIPLTFIAGVYGMNFSNMPELAWKYGYFMVWGLFLLSFLIMFAYFRRKKWF